MVTRESRVVTSNTIRPDIDTKRELGRYVSSK
jgi:hypothetical protein